MRTFILFWNPAISNWKPDDCRKAIDNGDIEDFVWPVWDHEIVQYGDRFFMARCGKGNTGIFACGHFSSIPFIGDDWSGKECEVHYAELDMDILIDTEREPILSTEMLQKEMPDFDWSCGHTGRLLQSEYTDKLEQLWATFLAEHEATLSQYTISKKNEDDEDDEDYSSVNDMSLEISLLDDGEIVLELKNINWNPIKKVKARTFKECEEMVSPYFTDREVDLYWKIDDKHDCDLLPVALAKQFVKALDLASWKHRDQKDKAGKAYFGHVVRVAKRCETLPAQIVALLHDVIEDTDVTPEMMEEMEFSEFIIKGVVCLTHREGESYEDYVRRAARNPIAREVKMADLEDNMELKRLPEVSDEDLRRLKKYREAWNYLKDYRSY